MNTKQEIEVGDLVMLQPSIKKLPRQTNRFAVVKWFSASDLYVPGREGWSKEVRLSHPLNGELFWDVRDLRVVDPAKIWNKAYRKGLCAGKNLKAKKKNQTKE